MDNCAKLRLNGVRFRNTNWAESIGLFDDQVTTRMKDIIFDIVGSFLFDDDHHMIE